MKECFSEDDMYIFSICMKKKLNNFNIEKPFDELHNTIGNVKSNRNQLTSNRIQFDIHEYLHLYRMHEHVW